jgi:hypothetical protein
MFPLTTGIPEHGTRDTSPGAAAYATAQGFANSTRVYNWASGPPAVTPATIWADYIADIDNGFVNLVSFERWVNPIPVAMLDNLGDADAANDVWLYNFDDDWSDSLGHTVTGVGYLDLGAPGIDGQEFFIVHDNWPGTVRNVAVQAWWGDPLLNTAWKQTDHIYIPEPVTIALAGLGIALVALRKHVGGKTD